MKQTIEIEVPDGKKAIWKDNKIIFEDIKPQLPRTWEEFCKQKNHKGMTVKYTPNDKSYLAIGISSMQRDMIDRFNENMLFD